MPQLDASFYTWLAAQPAYVEVAVGMTFVLVLAPVVLAAVAEAFTWLEEWAVLLWHAQRQADAAMAVPPLHSEPRIIQ
jgi:hypothetical protein